MLHTTLAIVTIASFIGCGVDQPEEVVSSQTEDAALQSAASCDELGDEAEPELDSNVAVQVGCRYHCQMVPIASNVSVSMIVDCKGRVLTSCSPGFCYQAHCYYF